MFSGCDNLTTVDFTNWNTTKITSFGYMFNDCISFNNFSIVANWNMSNATSISGMFNNCRNLSNITGLSKWNVSNVIYLWDIFGYCNNLTNNDLIEIAKMCVNININHPIEEGYVKPTYNLNPLNRMSPLYRSNKQINVTTVGQDLIDQLTAKGWTF